MLYDKSATYLQSNYFKNHFNLRCIFHSLVAHLSSSKYWHKDYDQELDIYTHIFKETRFSSCPLTFLIQFVHHGQYNFMLVTSKVPSVLLLLTLLVGQQEGHPACKKTERWGAGVDICLVRGADLHMPSWCHCYSLSLASVKSRLVLPFWYRPTRVVLEKGQLNRCECVLLPPNHLSPAS